jgi:hypothetical protein
MKNEAIQHLHMEIRKSAAYPYIFYYDLLNNPFYAGLRDDPHFQEIVKREKKLYEEHLNKYGTL